MMKSSSMPARRRPEPLEGTQASAASTPKGVIGMLRRHLWLIFIVTLLGTVAGGGGWYLLSGCFPLYRAETTLQVLPSNEADSRRIAATPAQPDVEHRRLIAIANLVGSPDSLVDLLDSEQVRKTNWFRKHVSTAGADANLTGPAKIDRAVNALEKSLTISPHREESRITLTMMCGNPNEAALIVNELARPFVSQPDGSEKQELRGRLAELKSQQAEAEGKISATERELQRRRETSGISDLNQSGEGYLQRPAALRLDDLQFQESELRRQVTQLRTDIGSLESLAEGPIADQIDLAVERDPVMILLTEQLTQLQTLRSGRLTKFGPDHRLVRQVQEQIAEIEAKRNERRDQIADQTRQVNLANARKNLNALQERLTELQRKRDQVQKQQNVLDEARAGYEQIVTERDEHIESLNQIEVQIDEVNRSLAAYEAPMVEQRRVALPPSEMVLSRHVLLWVPSGTLLGLLLGLSLALVVEMLNDQIRTPGDVTRFLHLPLLSVIPNANEDPGVGDIDLYHVVGQAPYSLLGEAYRRCRTNIDLSGPAGPKTLLIAGGKPGDGKTSVACNLAEAFAAKHEKVLLIDANLRQPRLHLVFPRTGSESAGDRRPGLTSILTGQCRIRDGIRPSGIGGLHLIYAGPPTTGPGDLLAGRQMTELVERVAGHYDRVIIDSPPVLLVSDVKVMSRVVDATVLVFSATATRRGVAQRTVRELAEVGANVIGCVLFGAEAMKGGYFHKEFKAYRDYLKPQLAASSA